MKLLEGTNADSLISISNWSRGGLNIHPNFHGYYIGIGVENTFASDMSIYPNPTTGILNIEGMEVTSKEFADYRKDVMLAVPVLYQAGYLTIADYDAKLNSFILDYPNLEVKSAFADTLADKYAYAPEITRSSMILNELHVRLR